MVLYNCLTLPWFTLPCYLGSGCHNPRQRGNIVDRKFALSHRKFQLISTHLLLSWVYWVKLSEKSYFFLEKINSFQTGIYFLWKLFIKFNLCYDKYVFVLPRWLEILTIFTREYRVLTGNLEIYIGADRKWKKLWHPAMQSIFKIRSKFLSRWS